MPKIFLLAIANVLFPFFVSAQKIDFKLSNLKLVSDSPANRGEVSIDLSIEYIGDSLNTFSGKYYALLSRDPLVSVDDIILTQPKDVYLMKDKTTIHFFGNEALPINLSVHTDISHIEEGRYYLIVKLFDVYGEADTSNNVISTPLAIGPYIIKPKPIVDYYIDSVKIDLSQWVIGGTMEVTTIVKNKMGNDCADCNYYSMSLYDENTIQSGKQIYLQGATTSSERVENGMKFHQGFYFYEDPQPGKYFLKVELSKYHYTDTDLTNNYKIIPITLPEFSTDLSIDSLILNGHIIVDISIFNCSFRVTNQGSLYSNHTYTVSIINMIADTVFSSSGTINIAPGVSKNYYCHFNNIYFQYFSAPVGMYLVKVSVKGKYLEVDSLDNSIIKKLIIIEGSNKLTVESTSINQKMISNANLQIVHNVLNNGSDIVKGNILYYLSKDTVQNANGILISQQSSIYGNLLQINENERKTITNDVYIVAPPGKYYLLSIFYKFGDYLITYKPKYEIARTYTPIEIHAADLNYNIKPDPLLKDTVETRVRYLGMLEVTKKDSSNYSYIELSTILRRDTLDQFPNQLYFYNNAFRKSNVNKSELNNSIIYYNFSLPDILEGKYFITQKLTIYSRYNWEGPKEVLLIKNMHYPIYVIKKKIKIQLDGEIASFVNVKKDSINISYTLSYTGKPNFDPIVTYHLSTDSLPGSDVYNSSEQTGYGYLAFHPRNFDGSNKINYNKTLRVNPEVTDASQYKYVIVEIRDNPNYPPYEKINYKYIKIKDGDIPLGLNEQIATNKAILYPNPSSTTVSISTALNPKAVKFTDATGRNVLEFHDSFINMDISGLPKGLYFVKVIDQEMTTTLKLMKQ